VASDGRPGRQAHEIESRIMAFMQRELLSPDVTFGPDQDLLSGGLLDSMAVLRLAAFVEAEFELKMQPSDFVIENFQTVVALTAYVQRAANHAGPPPSDSP
jgi:acyl carrier protein